MLRPLSVLMLLVFVTFPLHAQAYDEYGFTDRVYRQEYTEREWGRREQQQGWDQPYNSYNRHDQYRTNWKCPKRGYQNYGRQHYGYQNNPYPARWNPPLAPAYGYAPYPPPAPQIIYNYPVVRQPSLVIQYGF
jgi:hypothetical protein